MKSRRLAAYAASLAFVPAPPHVQYVYGSPPGSSEQEATGTAESVGSTGTVYYQAPMDKFTRAHETGHVFDYQVLSDGDRAYFQRLIHAPAGAWHQGTGITGTHSPSEWFADYYGAAATHLDPTKQGVSSYASIGRVRLKRFEAALARLGARRHLKPYS